MGEKNKRGNRVEQYFFPVDRSYFDSKHKNSDGWVKYETDLDAWHFGIWICTERRQIITYDRGDITRVYCTTKNSFHAEINALDEFYGMEEPTKVGT